jgi:hypothetical protein
MSHIMRRPILAAVLLLAMSAAAEDVYVPLSSRTEVQVANPSAVAVSIVVERLGTPAARELAVEPGQTVRFDEETEGVGVLRIAASSAVQVSAVSDCAECGSRVSLPVLASRDAALEGAITPRTGAWRSRVLAVNPEDGEVLLTVTVHRGAEVVEQSVVRIPGRGMRRVRLDQPGDRVTFDAPRPLLLFGVDSSARTGTRLFTPLTTAVGGKRRSVRSPSSPEPPPPPPEPQTIVLVPSKDNTLYESNGTLSNGKGVHVFAGTTASSDVRRALLAFDVASQIPPGSEIRSASLRLVVSQSIAGIEPMTLHRVSADWGEGDSNAGPSQDGRGANARTGDATWLHRFFPNQLWNSQGGDFTAAADATAQVDDVGTWPTSEAMVARVQGWLDQPDANFGWLVRGNEAGNATAKRFDSREIGTAATRPSLTIVFIPAQ